VYSASSQLYANALKKQFSLISTTVTSSTNNTRPPCKKQAAIINYNSDQSSPDAHPSTPAVTKSPNTQCYSKSPTATTTPNNYAKELLSIKKEISKLKALITTAVEQFKTAIKTLTATPWSSMSSKMDTDVEASMEQKTHNQNPTDFVSLIQDLKYEIATIVTKL